MTSRLTPKPRTPVLASALGSAVVVAAITTSGCVAPMPPPHDAGADAYVPPPMPPPMDAGDDAAVAPMPPGDTGLVPMVDGSLPPVDAGSPPPMPPPLDAGPEPDAAMDPDTGAIAPMPPPMPPPMIPPMPPPMPDPKS